MRIIQILLLLTCLLPIDAFGQRKVISGVVSDAIGTLPGATVALQSRQDKRALYGAVTNMNGEYVLNMMLNDDREYDIVFSFIGYKTKVIQYKGQKVLDMNLAIENTLIDEVVVIGQAAIYDGMGMNTALTAGSQDRIDLDDLKDMVVTSVEDMLQGQIANLDIIPGSGAPGTKMSMRIRGTASLTGNNDPLIVIDDIPQDVPIEDGFDFATANEDDFGQLLGIAPSDIQSITVLKDAAATVLWGAQASNGVLVVTTKVGKTGMPTFELTQRLRTSIEPKRVPMLSGMEYVTLMQDAIWNKARDEEFSRTSLNQLSKYKDILYDPSYIYFEEFKQETDWLDYVRRTPIGSETNFSMSGGGDKIGYRFSANYLNDIGTTIGENYSRINSSLNLDFRFSQKFIISSKFSYSDGTRSNAVENVRGLALGKMPNMTPYELDDYGNMAAEYFIQPPTTIQGNNRRNHPIAMAKESSAILSEKKSDMNFYLKYNPFKGLSFNGTIALTLGNKHKKGYLPFSATGVSWTDKNYNRSEEHQSYTMKLFSMVNVNYNKGFKKNSFTISLRGSMNQNSNASQFTKTSGHNGIELSDPSVGGIINSIGGTFGEGKSLSLTAAFLYSYGSKYNLSISAGTGGGSGAGRNSRWAISPAIGLNYNVHRESFLKNFDLLNSLVVRASLGYTLKGATGASTYDGIYSGVSEEYIDMGALIPSSMRLDNVGYEKLHQFNTQVNMSLFNNKLSMFFNYYVKTTKDLLQRNMKIPSSSGFSKIDWFNDGSVENRGWEASLTAKNLLGKNSRGWNLSFNVNISRNRNVVLDLPSSLEYQQAKISNGQYANKIVEGVPLGAFYGFDYLGVYHNFDQTVARDESGYVIKDIKGNNVVTSISGIHKQRPGDAQYRDLNYDGIIDKYDIIYLGNSMPILNGGAGLTISWRDLSFRTAFHFRIGQSVINQARFNSESMSGTANQSTAVSRRWRYEGDPTDIPRALWGTNYNSLGSNRFVEKASFMKIKDLTLSYRLPKYLVSRIGLKGARFVVSCYNPFTFTNYRGQDPEVGIPSGFKNLAMDNSMSPRARSFAAGLTINF